MKENRELIQAVVAKADMAVADLAAGGAEVREQVNRFLVIMIVKDTLLPLVRTMTIGRNQREIPKMTTFGGNVMHPAVESQALTIAQRVRPGFGQVILTTFKGKCQVDFPEEVLRRQVEGPAFKNTMLAYLALHVKRDIGDKLLNGNTVTGATPWLRQANGMRALATTNVFPAGNVDLSGDVLDTTILTMPLAFEDVEERAVFLTNRNAHAAYRRELGLRIGGLGDSHVVDKRPLMYDDVPVVKVPLMPGNLGGGLNETVVLYLDPKNMIYAVEENLVVRSEYAIREDVWTVVMTITYAQQYEHEPMVVQTTQVNG